ncbi:MAG: HAMP domain-containing sensor histidine kinase [Candidatus Hydrothermales bacterium]
MDISMLLSFIKEISAEVDLERIKRFLEAFLRNFFKGYTSFDVFIGEKKEEIKPLFRDYVNEKEIISYFINIKDPIFEKIENISFYKFPYYESSYIFYFPFYHFGELFGFILIDFKDKLNDDSLFDLKVLSSFIGPIFLTSYLYKKRRESEKRLELSYDLILFSTRVYDEGRICDYIIKNIYENLSDIDSVCFYKLKGDFLIPYSFRGGENFEILNIEVSFPGEAVRKMKTTLRGSELSVLVPTRDFIHGVLYLKKKRGTFELEEVKTIEMIANTLSISVENANFIKELRERKEGLEEELKLLLENRIKEEKLAFVGKVAAGLVHELKNLISGILGLAELLELKIKDESIKEIIKTLRDEGNTMNYLLSSLLDISKPFRINLSWASLKNIVERSIYICKFFVKGKNIFFNINVPENVKILCDEVKFELTLVNLIKNSIEAIEESGEIKVNFRKNLDFILEIEDNGKGIEDKYIEKIFEPFFTTKEKGAGLGLSFVKKVIEAHGFSIKVSSIINRGTKFSIYIPQKFIEGSNP